ncbi:MAG: cation diffusion facilitator family transporter [Dissulfurispiraceae bacterium]|jgi:cation diffusion facilitator family transporter|nr:cation diffusion facilitator family transporter [Dissulfurispiraceae bacterium]
MSRAQQIRKVLLLTLGLNLAVSTAKIIYGYLTSSVAMISDGYHSLFDGVSNIAGLIGVAISSIPPDKSHPYGHRKYETVFTIFIGVLMLITCFEIFKKVYSSFTGVSEPVVTTASFVIMLITISVNLFVSTYERRKGEELESEFLIADSKHTQSDIYISCGVITSFILIKSGVPYADPVIGSLVGLLVAKAGYEIIKESTEVLVDAAGADIQKIREIACNVQGVKDCHAIRARGSKGHVFIDLHILVDPFMTVRESHLITEETEHQIKTQLPDIVDVVIHIEPYEKKYTTAH